MTDNNPPTQTDNSANNPYLPTYSTSSNILPYGNYSPWSNLWSSNYSGYAIMAVDPALHPNIPPYGTRYVPQKPLQPSAASSSSKVHKFDPEPTSIRVNTPPLPDPDTYRHWDDVLNKFLEKTNLTQCRRGFELDMLVLNAEWERRILPEALKDLVHGMQVILDRISGKARGDTEVQADVNDTTTPLFEPPLDERKLEYIELRDGQRPESQSSITKSISQFLARSRARNDLSNRAEFLQTLAEKRQALSAGIPARVVVDSDSMTVDAEETQDVVVSCARVDAKTIDRAQQIKYDIMKNEDGPLTRTASIKLPPSDSGTTTSQSLPESIITPSSPTSAMRRSSPLDQASPRKRRRLVDVDSSASKSKSGVTEDQAPISLTQKIQHGTDVISPTLMPAVDERIRNIEEHLSVRYVPSQPQTLLTRLKYLEDHLVRLEKEYPPWAALHFKQPNRGWPPPPRSTPIIVAPHLRSTNGSGTDSVHPSGSIHEKVGQPPLGTTKAKPRQKNSTLHKAVMDRLEIQQAMNEMGIQ